MGHDLNCINLIWLALLATTSDRDDDYEIDYHVYNFSETACHQFNLDFGPVDIFSVVSHWHFCDLKIDYLIASCL